MVGGSLGRNSKKHGWVDDIIICRTWLLVEHADIRHTVLQIKSLGSLKLALNRFPLLSKCMFLIFVVGLTISWKTSMLHGIEQKMQIKSFI